jgi:hypothetical protein
MLLLAFVVLSAVVVAGIVLALLHLRGVRPHRVVGALHGLAGAAGLAVLLLALRGPPRGVLSGVESFGDVAAVVGVAALVAGLGIVVMARRSWGGVGLVIGVHATLAVTGYVVLLAYVSLG